MKATLLKKKNECEIACMSAHVLSGGGGICQLCEGNCVTKFLKHTSLLSSPFLINIYTR